MEEGKTFQRVILIRYKLRIFIYFCQEVKYADFEADDIYKITKILNGVKYSTILLWVIKYD